MSYNETFFKCPFTVTCVSGFQMKPIIYNYVNISNLIFRHPFKYDMYRIRLNMYTRLGWFGISQILISNDDDNFAGKGVKKKVNKLCMKNKIKTFPHNLYIFTHICCLFVYLDCIVIPLDPLKWSRKRFGKQQIN